MYLNFGKVRPYLTTRSLKPENQETPIHFISLLQPVADALFYRRYHFPYPILTPDSFTLKISGSVDQALLLHYPEFLKLPSKSERSLPIAKALHPEVMIAYEYNGKPISHKHGYPFRLILPGWYGMASVKWLSEIILVKDKFTGPFQNDDYVYYYKNGTSEPDTTNKVNSTIQQPLDKQISRPLKAVFTK